MQVSVNKFLALTLGGDRNDTLTIAVMRTFGHRADSPEWSPEDHEVKALAAALDESYEEIAVPESFDLVALFGEAFDPEVVKKEKYLEHAKACRAVQALATEMQVFLHDWSVGETIY